MQTLVGAECLTRRETEILRLLTKGLSNQEIADTLVISEQAVANRITGIMNKLGISRRMRLAIYALKVGLITLDEID